jgi:hypothetical protein
MSRLIVGEGGYKGYEHAGQEDASHNDTGLAA